MKTLNCYNSEPVRAFDLGPMLRARPKYQLLSGSLVVEGLHAAKLSGIHAAKGKIKYMFIENNII